MIDKLPDFFIRGQGCACMQVQVNLILRPRIVVIDRSGKLLEMDSGVKRTNRSEQNEETRVNIRNAAMATHDSCFWPSGGNSANNFCDTSGCGSVEIEVSAMCRDDGGVSRFLRSALRQNGAGETLSRESAPRSRLPWERRHCRPPAC